MFGGLMSTMVKHWSVTSRCHRFTRKSSALMNVSCTMHDNADLWRLRWCVRVFYVLVRAE